MEEIKSGKELCDEFFNRLFEKKDIDMKIAKLLKTLYEAGNLTKDKISQGLESLRRGNENGNQS